MPTGAVFRHQFRGEQGSSMQAAGAQIAKMWRLVILS